MSVVTVISVVSPPPPPEPAGAGAVQMLCTGDGRRALTLVSCMAPAPTPRR